MILIQENIIQENIDPKVEANKLLKRKVIAYMLTTQTFCLNIPFTHKLKLLRFIKNIFSL